MARPRAATEPSIRTELSERQREVLELVAKGFTNGSIAPRLGITLDGVKWHVSEILTRLGVDSRDEAVRVWRERTREERFDRLRALIPGWSLWLKIAAGGFALTASAAAIAFIYRGSEGGGPVVAEPSSSQSPGVVSPLTTPTPTSLPTGQAQACQGPESISTSTQAVGDEVVFEVRMTKLRSCDLIEPTEVRVSPDALDPQAPLLAVHRGSIVAVAGTDRVIVTIRWRNWCQAVPTPAPTLPPGPGWTPPAVEYPLRFMWELRTPRGIAAQPLYPPCTNPAGPPLIEMSVRMEPNPPEPLVVASSAPAIAGLADVEPFARWFEAVVTARDSAVLSALIKPVSLTCGTIAYPLCLPTDVGVVLNGNIMAAQGTLGTEATFRSQVNLTMAASGPLRAIGCAVASPNCEYFVLAFEAIPGNGPGSYHAYVFEVQAGVPILRGQYPGGGDVATVFGGGRADAPWGAMMFVPVGP